MAQAIFDEASFERFLADNETAVIGFIGQDGEAAQFAALADAVLPRHPGVAFALVSGRSRALFDMFGLDGTATAIFRARVGMYLEAGMPAAHVLERLLAGIGALNMDRVRAEIEQEKAARESLAVHRVCPATRRGKL